MTIQGDPPEPTAPARRGQVLVRLLVYLLVLSAPLWVGTGGTGATPLDRDLVAVTEQRKFSLAGWMAGAIAERAERSLVTPVRADSGADSVRQYVELTREIQAADAQSRRVAASETDGTVRSVRLAQIATSRAELEGQREALRPATEDTIAVQIEAILADEQVRAQTVSIAGNRLFPFFAVQVRPGVAFRLGESPDVLIVSPRDRIAVVGSVLLKPDTSIAAAESMEDQVDSLGVSSIVSATGGLAAYPTMVVPSSSLRRMLGTISHEWTHQYLAFTSLGSRYFEGYDMRTINETVADLVGEELGDITYSRYYDGAVPADKPSTSQQVSSTTAPTFGDVMGTTRVTVDSYLRQGDVAGAERYMAQQRLVLVGLGYQVRKLNTAYLSFFGSYSAGENPYETKLRQLRAQSGSLAAFLRLVGSISAPADLDRLLARPS